MLPLSQDAIEFPGAEEGSEVHAQCDWGENRVIIQPTSIIMKDIDETFARQVNEFIDEYRSALEALAKDNGQEKTSR